MRSKRRTKLITLMLSALMLTAFTLPVSAATKTESDIQDSLIVDSAGSKGESSLLPEERLSDIEKDFGSITITLSDGEKGTSKEGVKFSCLKIADIVDGEYELADEYETLGVDINGIQNSSDLEAAAKKISEVAGEGTIASTDMNGKLVFSNLEVGVYLVETTDDSCYDDVTPLLISIPTWNETDGLMDYDVNVIPKHTPKPDETCEKKPCPQTGIDDYTWVYFGGAALVLVALVVFNTVGRKKRA